MTNTKSEKTKKSNRKKRSKLFLQHKENFIYQKKKKGKWIYEMGSVSLDRETSVQIGRLHVEFLRFSQFFVKFIKNVLINRLFWWAIKILVPPIVIFNNGSQEAVMEITVSIATRRASTEIFNNLTLTESPEPTLTLDPTIALEPTTKPTLTPYLTETVEPITKPTQTPDPTATHVSPDTSPEIFVPTQIYFMKNALKYDNFEYATNIIVSGYCNDSGFFTSQLPPLKGVA